MKPRKNISLNGIDEVALLRILKKRIGVVLA